MVVASRVPMGYPQVVKHSVGIPCLHFVMICGRTLKWLLVE